VAKIAAALFGCFIFRVRLIARDEVEWRYCLRVGCPIDVVNGGRDQCGIESVITLRSVPALFECLNLCQGKGLEFIPSQAMIAAADGPDFQPGLRGRL
jgi:hypothetical protein